MLILEGLLTFITHCDLALQHGCLATISTKFNHIRIPILESIPESNQLSNINTTQSMGYIKAKSFIIIMTNLKKITYSKLDLLNISYSIKHDLRYKLLASGVCQTIRKYWIV